MTIEEETLRRPFPSPCLPSSQKKKGTTFKLDSERLRPSGAPIRCRDTRRRRKRRRREWGKGGERSDGGKGHRERWMTQSGL
ncbi:hypothetical protein PRIPAC_95634 [Pristionchus pacificus]|uniref:Uncharacterized protein n=1 Tax=Pristionchus pacificus TaxID=54126 RepID=A0A2A6D0Y2_PRIPA|nr:hypothetical protein PRIPAC_95634 [Pristionchus pacificus]|eukprot:PDM84065.1 hypothetical protein PRIPAC_34257 [Pristionchus pacificus]